MACVAAATLTYVSLIVPGSVIALCGNVGTPIYCPVLAYGFPLPYIADNQAVSPVGSVATGPLSLLIGLDDVLWTRLGLTFSFWLLASVGGGMASLHIRYKYERH